MGLGLQTPNTSIAGVAGLEAELAAGRQAENILAADGNNVQVNLDARTYQIGSAEAADATAPVVPAAVVRIATTEGYTGSGVGAAPYTVADSEPSVTDTEKFAVKVREIDGTLMDKWAQLADDLGAVTSSHFRIRGPGYETEDDGHIQDFFAAVARRSTCGVMMPFQHTVTSPIDFSGVTLNGAWFLGAQGQSLLTCAAAYHVVHLGDTDGAIFDGIGFRTDYTNATVDPGSAVVYSYQNSHKSTIFRNCYFSAPTANTSGLSLYTAVNYLDTAASVDGFLIEDCTFENLGCQGSTIMNRSTDPTRMKRVHFVRCVARHLGLGGDYGMAASFDGTGYDCSYQDGWLEDLLITGLENVGYHNTHFLRNTCIDFSRGWRLLSIDGTRSSDAATWGPEAGIPQTMHGCRIEGNRQVGSTSGALGSNAFDLDRTCVWRDNDIFADDGTAPKALLLRRCSDVVFGGGSVVNYNAAGQYAIFADSGTTNPVVRCTFDNMLLDNSATGASGQAAIGFFGSSANNNLITNCTMKRASAGFTIAQISGAVGNVCDPYRDGNGSLTGEYLSLNMGDTNVTLSNEQAMLRYKAIRIVAGNTVQQNLNFPSRRQLEQAPRIINNGTAGVQLQVAGVNGSLLAAGASATLVYDTALGSVRAI